MTKLDGVIEAVRYKGGKIELVRLYERRGPTYSDHVLLDRAKLLERLRQGKRLFTGRRTPLLASTFELDNPVVLSGSNGDAVITTPGGEGQDKLEDVPLF